MIAAGAALPPDRQVDGTSPDPESEASTTRWHLALAAIDLITTPDARLGGILVRARPGPVRDAFTAALAARARTRRLPASADAASLDGGLDLTATLAAGRPVHRPGLLAETAGSILLVPMAERLSPPLAARLAAALDAAAPPCLVLFDESDPQSDDEVAAALADRLAIHLDLGAVMFAMADLLADEPRARIKSLRRGAPTETGTGRSVPSGDLVEVPVSVGTRAGAEPLHPLSSGSGNPPKVSAQPVEPFADPETALATAAAALGIASIRAPILAQRLARLAAAAAGRDAIAGPDLDLAAALVLGPRATRLPPGDAPSDPETPQNPPPSSAEDSDSPADIPDQTTSDAADRILEAAQTALPPGLLDALAAGGAARSTRSGTSGAKLRSLTSGRPAGVRAGMPGRGARLALIETIKAAAPWQRLRPTRPDGRLSIRPDDLRIRRFVARAEATTVFAVDASGSAAFARLAEAKGAVELLLAQAYVKRAEVALIAFRGDGAAVVLPPTRSLARAKRELAGLAGGGGTPMAAGLDLARRVAEVERARGRTPLVVVLTDGRANVGATTALSPQEAALASARGFATSGLKAVFIDCSARPRPEGAALAAAMAARFVALPRLDARAVVAAVAAAS